MVEVEPVWFAKERIGGQRKIQDKDVAARLDDSSHFSEGSFTGRHIAQAERDCRDIEGAVGKWKRCPVSVDQRRHPLCDGLEEHGLAEVCSDDFGIGAAAAEDECKITAACGQVEDAGGAPRLDQAGGDVSPSKVSAQAECVICEIVSTGDGCKGCPDEFRILVAARRLMRVYAGHTVH